MKITLIEEAGGTEGRRLYFEHDIDPRYVVMDILSPKGGTLISRCLLNREEIAALGRAFAQPVAHRLKRS